MVEDYISYEEYNMERDRVRGCNCKLYDLAQRLKKEQLRVD